MRHFPLFADLNNRKILVSGAGETAVAKIRLLLKTSADIRVFGTDPAGQILDWHNRGSVNLLQRELQTDDFSGAFLVYCANDDEKQDQLIAQLARKAGALVNIVDNLEDSDFITPAIVDRAPVTVAIATEGKAPVLARRIKSDLEQSLPSRLGQLARLTHRFRDKLATIADSATRRDILQQFYFGKGPAAFDQGGEARATELFDELFTETTRKTGASGTVSLIGTGPGDAELLTLKAVKKIRTADVVIHDRLVSAEILEFARREAIVIETGKKGFGASWKQEDINQLMVDHARSGATVARLKSGDPTIYGRLDEEIDALEAADIKWEIVPGITTASAVAAGMGQSLTRRNRNSSLRYLTGHDIEGFAEHDWRDLAKPGSVAAIYMGVRAASFIRGRLLMHGANEDTPVTIVENASRSDQKTITATLLDLPYAIETNAVTGPAILIYGLAPRYAECAIASNPSQRQYTGS